MQVGAKYTNLKTWRQHAKEKAVVAFMILELLEDRVKRGKTREWLKERAEKGMFQIVIKLSLQDTPAFKEIMRMSPDHFKEILNATELPWVPEVLFFFREERAVKTERRKINLWSRRL